jgi:hypothetical protein
MKGKTISRAVKNQVMATNSHPATVLTSTPSNSKDLSIQIDNLSTLEHYFLNRLLLGGSYPKDVQAIGPGTAVDCQHVLFPCF